MEEVSRTRVRVSRITRLTNDLALALAAPSVRVEVPVPGNPVIGIEVPSADRRLVSLRGVLESKEFRETTAQLPLVLGRDVAGAPIVVDLTMMPHLLIAGATGSGKSVCINSLIACLLMRFSPQMLRLVMVDPKRVELTGYGNIPHLAFSHVITDVDEVVAVLHVVVTEMERRYRRFESAGVRNVAAFNAKSERGEALPFWIVIIDELADLMMAAPIEAEQHLVRLAQLARATGIHLVIATQRPSVDVVTGLIKANFPTRVAFATASQTDARVILDKAGAEKLLGRGDMLFRSTDSTKERRLQGAFVSDEEIAALIAFWTQDRFTDTSRPTLDHLLQQALAERGPPAEQETPAADAPGGRDSEPDSLYEPAVALAAQHTRISTSLLQRRLRIGYPAPRGSWISWKSRGSERRGGRAIAPRPHRSGPSRPTLESPATLKHTNPFVLSRPGAARRGVSEACPEDFEGPALRLPFVPFVLRRPRSGRLERRTSAGHPPVTLTAEVPVTRTPPPPLILSLS